MRDSTEPREPSGPRVISAYMPYQQFIWAYSAESQADMWIQRLSTIIVDNPWAVTVAVVIPGTTEQAREMQSNFNASFGERQRNFAVEWGTFKVNEQTDAVIALMQKLEEAQTYIIEHSDPCISCEAKRRFDRMQRRVNLLERLKIIVMPIVAPYSGWGAFASSAMQAATMGDLTAVQLALGHVVEHERGILVPIVDEGSAEDDAVDRIGRLGGDSVEAIEGVSCMLTIARTTLSVFAGKFGHSTQAFEDLPAWEVPTHAP
ncbi:MAG: hypothetical protein P1U34_10115 [Coxiellaceae bacterium]|nr:hypothetical protein [Coxiellaceae bacterium]